MKKILFILLVVLFAGSATIAVADEAKPGLRRAQMVQRYSKKTVAAEHFLEMVREGNLEAISKVQDISLFQAKDKFGNNCFHLAKDAATLQALSGVIRQTSSQAGTLLTQLRNEHNDMGETPLMAHISYGKADTFLLLYRGSDLEASIQKVEAIDKGGALSLPANIHKELVINSNKDKAGRTVAQVAVINADKPGMDRVIRFFQTHAPYLF